MTSRRLLTAVLLAVVAAGYSGCGGDDESGASDKAATTPTSEPTAAETVPSDPSAPTVAELKKLTCREVEFGLTSTDTTYLISGVSSAAGVDINTAVNTVEEICERGTPRTRPYGRALRLLG